MPLCFLRAFEHALCPLARMVFLLLGLAAEKTMSSGDGVRCLTIAGLPLISIFFLCCWRRTIREAKGVAGNIFFDCLATYCCPCCSIFQVSHAILFTTLDTDERTFRAFFHQHWKFFLKKWVRMGRRVRRYRRLYWLLLHSRNESKIGLHASRSSIINFLKSQYMHFVNILPFVLLDKIITNVLSTDYWILVIFLLWKTQNSTIRHFGPWFLLRAGHSCIPVKVDPWDRAFLISCMYVRRAFLTDLPAGFTSGSTGVHAYTLSKLSL